jgi:hypothetical protein
MNLPCFLEPDFGTHAPDITEQSFLPNLRKVLRPRDAYAAIHLFEGREKGKYPPENYDSGVEYSTNQSSLTYKHYVGGWEVACHVVLKENNANAESTGIVWYKIRHTKPGDPNSSTDGLGLYLCGGGLDPRMGRLWWTWQKSMKGEEIARIWGAKDPDIASWIWDGAGGHRDEDMQTIEKLQVVQPPYAPELNLMERFFRELRQAIEGRVYPDLQAKQDALEPILKAWQADPAQVRQLCDWRWIRKALKNLPVDTQVASSFWIGITPGPMMIMGLTLLTTNARAIAF